MVDIRLEVFGDVQISRRLLRMGAFAGDMRPVLEELADDFNLIEARQFDSQGASGSGGWKQLAAATVAAKTDHRPPLDPRILHATLAMRNSLTRKGAAGARRTVTGVEMSVVTVVKSKKGYPYPQAHQLGRKVPRRRPVQFTDEDRRRWVRILQARLVASYTAAA